MLWLWLTIAGIAAAVVLTLFQDARQQIWALVVVDALQRRGKQAQAKKFLERMVNERTLLGERSKANTRFRLAWMYMDEGNYEAAAAQLRTALSARQPPNVANMLRQRLADCLEGLGDAAGAAAEREKICADASAAPRDTDWYLNEARRHEQSRRYPEACAVYREALKQLPTAMSALRPRILVQLALASFNAGHAEEMVRYAEEALTLNPEGSTRLSAHSAAGIGYSTLGDLDRSEAHRQRAYELALAAGNQDQAAKQLVSMGLVRMKRGQLVEAIQAAEEAVRLSVGARRQARMLEADCMRLRGQWEQARSAYEQARRAKQLPKPSEERRSQGILMLAQSWLEADCNENETALRLLDAAPDLATDPKLSLWSAATRARVLAQMGRGDEARALIAELDARLAQTTMDVEVLRTCHATMGHALFSLGDFQQCAERWRRYLDSGPDPVFRPSGFYFIGMCLRQLGDQAGARAALQEAVDLGFQTYYTREARRALS